MSERDLLEQIEDALSGEVSHDIVRAWLWIRVVHSGSVTHEELREQFDDSRTILADGLRLGIMAATNTEVKSSEWTFKKSEAGDNSATHVRLRRARKKRKGDAPVTDHLETLSGREKINYAFAHPRSKACQFIIRNVTVRVSRVFAKAYEARTGRKYWPAMIVKNERSFRMMGRWCNERGLRYEEWIRYCEKAYKRRTKRKAFPAPSNCCGPWVCSLWEEETAPKEHKHAGHTYRKVSENIRSRLTDAGFDMTRHNDEMIEYLESRAKEKTTLSEMYQPEPDDELEKIVDWVVSHEVSNGNG